MSNSANQKNIIILYILSRLTQAQKQKKRYGVGFYTSSNLFLQKRAIEKINRSFPSNKIRYVWIWYRSILLRRTDR